jgi:O-antigen/teichoic acid export membrane protein
MSYVLNVSDYLVSWYFAAFLLNNLAQVALYTTGTAMVRQALALLYTPLVGIQVPFFTRVRGGESSLPSAYATIGRILACILIPGGVGLVLLARELILVQYPDYAEAALVVAILTPCLFLESFLSSSQIVLQVYERYKLLLLPRALTLLFLPLLVWVAPKYGLVGVTLAIGGGRVLIALVTAILAQRAFPLRYSWAFFGRVILATMAMAVVVVGLQWLLGLDDTIGDTLMQRLVAAGQLLGIAAAGAGSFVVALRAMGGLEPEDRQRILESRLPLRRWLTKLL